jgi:hypothetical protein
MSATNAHVRLLANAAKAILSPIGCTRIGRSRTWIADQRFWVIVIEFQPSSYSKGSHLNVGAHWLWHAQDSWSFDYGHRVVDFIFFRNEEQFAVAAEKLATRAVEEVHNLQRKFSSLSDIAREVAKKPHGTEWDIYHAAVAAGLTGDVANARRLFEGLIEGPPTWDWHAKLQADATILARTLPDVVKFRETVIAIIQKARALHRLPPDPTCLEAS